jgi:hypothetical protein
MNTKHLTDDIIQAYILQEISDNQIALHILECANCKAKMESYQTLMNTIGNLKSETFPFDVTALVLQKIEATETKKTALGSYALIAVLSVFFMGVILLIIPITEPIIQMFRSLNVIDNAFLTVSAVCVLIFLIKDTFRQYKQKEMLLLQ